MDSVKLDRLIIKEVSGVDDPANMLPGFMVLKSASEHLAVGNELEAFTKASASKEPYGDVAYADPGYQEDGKKRYPLDTESHIRAAWSYINQADNASAYSADQLATIKSKIRAAMKRIGAEMEGTAKAESESNIVAKIRELILGAPTGKDDLDMDKAELTEILDERDEALVAKVTEAVAKSVGAPAEGEGAAEEAPAAEAAEAVAAITAEDVQKAIEEAVAPFAEIAEKTLDRLEAVESKLGVAARKSLDGQEDQAGDDEVTKSAPDLADAIAGAFKR